MTAFGERLRKLRREADITQDQLAKALGVVPSAVGKYERVDDSYPSVEVLIKIADYFSVSLDYLLRGTEPQTMENNVSGALLNSSVIQANHGGVVFNGEQAVSPEAVELLNIYDNLSVRERLKLLNFAVDLEERSKER